MEEKLRSYFPNIFISSEIIEAWIIRDELKNKCLTEKVHTCIDCTWKYCGMYFLEIDLMIHFHKTQNKYQITTYFSKWLQVSKISLMVAAV